MEEPATTPLPDLGALLRHRAWLRRLAASLVVDAASADDLAQQTLLAALERPPPRADAPRAWLAAAVRNLARKLVSSERSRVARERLAAASEATPSTDEVVARAAIEHDVSTAVLALPEPYRTAVLLRFFDDLPPRVIARRSDAPVETVQTRIKRGVELVRAELVKRRGSAAVLVGLLDRAGRSAVKRAFLMGGAATSGALEVVGGFDVSTKAKLAATAVLLVAGVLVVVEMRNRSSRRSEFAVTANSPSLPARVDRPPTPVPMSDASGSEPIETVATRAVVPAESTSNSKGTIRGVVRTSRGTPAAGALIVVQDSRVPGRWLADPSLLCSAADNLIDFGNERRIRGSSSRGARDPDMMRFAKSAADGTFVVDDLEPTPGLDVAAIHPSEGMTVVNGVVLDLARPVPMVELQLPVSVALVGSVHDTEGRPVRGARLSFGGFALDRATRRGSSLGVLEIGEDGNYRSLAYDFNSFSMACYADGYVSVQRGPFPIAAGEREHREDFTLERAIVMTGRVLRPDGSPARLDLLSEPIAVWATEIDPRDWKNGPGHSEGGGRLLREEDRYEIACRLGSERFVSLWCRDALLGWSEIVTRGVGPDVTLDATRITGPAKTIEVTVEVVDSESGKPVPEYEVTFSRRKRDNLHYEQRGGRGACHDPSGRASVARLELGHYEIVVRAAGFAPKITRAVVADEPDRAPLRIEVARPVAPLEGQVVDRNGAPVVNARVLLLDPQGLCALPAPECFVSTNADGRFAFAELPEADYLVLAETDELAPAMLEAREGDEHAVLTLSPGVKVGLRYEEFASSFGVQFVIRDERGVIVVDDDRPRGRIVGGPSSVRLASGDYTAEAFAPGFASKPVRFTAAPGTIVTLKLAPEPLPAAR
jgi:RNA polymerase sigma-70 factor (ECF subfamily)